MRMTGTLLALYAACAFAAPVAGAAGASEEIMARGARISADLCAECHGRHGRGKSSDYPSLAGQHAEYIVKQVFNFKTGQRRNEEMEPVLEKLLAADIRAVAQYLSTLPPGFFPASDEGLRAEGRQVYLKGNPATKVSACSACHGEDAKGGATMPRLAGQNPTYLRKQMNLFIEKTRTNDQLAHVMHGSMAAMTAREVNAAAVFLASLQ
jgi:cytochrome c553